MAIVRDIMPAFELFQPATVDDALRLLAQHGADAWVMAGGLDSFDWLKDRIKRPKVVVDLSGIAELKGVRFAADPQPGHHRRQCLAGHALLVLPCWLAMLPGRRQHLLCRHTNRAESRARD